MTDILGGHIMEVIKQVQINSSVGYLKLLRLAAGTRKVEGSLVRRKSN